MTVQIVKKTVRSGVFPWPIRDSLQNCFQLGGLSPELTTFAPDPPRQIWRGGLLCRAGQGQRPVPGPRRGKQRPSGLSHAQAERAWGNVSGVFLRAIIAALRAPRDQGIWTSVLAAEAITDLTKRVLAMCILLRGAAVAVSNLLVRKLTEV